jgi:hypothetical protein
MRHSNEPASLKARYRRTTGPQRKREARAAQRFICTEGTYNKGRNAAKRARRAAVA